MALEVEEYVYAVLCGTARNAAPIRRLIAEHRTQSGHDETTSACADCGFLAAALYHAETGRQLAADLRREKVN